MFWGSQITMEQSTICSRKDLLNGPFIFNPTQRGTHYYDCDDEFYGLHFDLPSNDVLEEGQILVVLYNVSLLAFKKWTSGKSDLSLWPHISVWGTERGKYVGS